MQQGVCVSCLQQINVSPARCAVPCSLRSATCRVCNTDGTHPGQPRNSTSPRHATSPVLGQATSPVLRQATAPVLRQATATAPVLGTHPWGWTPAGTLQGPAARWARRLGGACGAGVPVRGKSPPLRNRPGVCPGYLPRHHRLCRARRRVICSCSMEHGNTIKHAVCHLLLFYAWSEHTLGGC